MKLLNWIFELLEPKGKTNYFSVRFARWKSKRKELQNNRSRIYNTEPSTYFNVPGAGDICISDNCHHFTGNVVGFSFGVEWGEYGYCGGVIGRDEAKRMAEFILIKCSEVTEDMAEESIRLRKEMFNKITTH